MAQSSVHFTDDASGGQESGQSSEGTVRLLFMCHHLLGLGPQMVSSLCFFNFYFSLSHLFLFQDFFIAFLEISVPKTTEMAFIKILHQRAEVFVRTSGATNH